MTEPTPSTLAPTTLIDSDHPAVIAFAREHARGADVRARAVALYYAVRDEFRYDTYRVDLSPHGMRASTVITSGYGWCVPKAALLAAAARALGIPARVGYADVRNHLSTERMRQMMQTDLFIWHGYTDLWIDGAWRKATPAFNLTLCERFDLLPLEFDGHEDSIYHPFDKAGNRHMEYVHQRGAFDDMPVRPSWTISSALIRSGSPVCRRCSRRASSPTWTASRDDFRCRRRAGRFRAVVGTTRFRADQRATVSAHREWRLPARLPRRGKALQPDADLPRRMMATFCDMLLPLGVHAQSAEVRGRFLPTVSLQIDYLAPAPLGAWVQGEAQLLRATRTMVFAQGLVMADGAAAARVSGILKIGPPFDDLRLRATASSSA